MVDDSFFSGGIFAPPDSWVVRVLRGDEISLSIINGPSLRKVRQKAYHGWAVQFIVAPAPESDQDAFAVRVYLKKISDWALLDIKERGILTPGIASFGVAKETFPFFDYRFPVDFPGVYAPDVSGSKGILHIPEHAPWKDRGQNGAAEDEG